MGRRDSRLVADGASHPDIGSRASSIGRRREFGVRDASHTSFPSGSALVSAIVAAGWPTSHSARVRARRLGGLRGRARGIADIVRMLVRRAVAAICGADPIAVPIARIAAAGRIVVPFAPIQLAIAIAASAEAVNDIDQSPAAGAIEAAQLPAVAELA